MQNENESKYWAAKSTENIGPELVRKIDDYYQHLQTSGRLALLRRCHEYYYKQALSGAKLRKGGEQGELTTVNINHYRNLMSHLRTMITQQRASFDAKATNTDYKSQAQTILANGLLEYYTREKKLERYVKAATESALVYGEGFVESAWEAQEGEVYGINPETQAEIREGDLRFSSYTPLDAIRDYSSTSASSQDWIILRSYRNKYTLAAKYPELEENILSVSTTADEVTNRLSISGTLEDTDNIPFYIFYHRKTPALPEGRLIEFLDASTILIDSALPYRDIPVFRIAPDEMTGTIWGYTIGFDILPIQEALDGLYSTVLTNQSAFGVQNITAPRGHNLSSQQLAGGLNLIEYDQKAGGPPQPLNLTQTPPEIFNFMSQLERLAETISGVNSVARGNPEASLKSGAALALVQSMAVQFSIGLQHSYTQLLEDVGTSVIQTLQDFATVPRVAMITGRANRSLMKQFTGDDLSQVSRVLVDLGNPLTRTIAGRVNLAETLLANQLVKTPETYIQVLTTGRLEPVIEGDTAEMLLIRSENEHLAEGRQVYAALTDDHLQHIHEHKVVIASPEARENPTVVRETLAHIKEHLDILSKPENAQMLALLGQQPIPQAPAPEASGAVSNVTPIQLPKQPNLPNPPAGTDPRSVAAIEEEKASIEQVQA
jgi:hypothetical protein